MPEQRIQVRADKIIETLSAIGLAVQASEITGNEYITILGNLCAQVLSENPKKLEHDFIRNIKQDTLQRRIKKLPQPTADRVAAAERIRKQMMVPEPPPPIISAAAEAAENPPKEEVISDKNTG